MFNYNEEKLVPITGYICNKCLDWNQRTIMETQNTYKMEFCKTCGEQGSRSNMESEEDIIGITERTENKK